MRLRFLFSSQTRPSDVESRFIHVDPPSKGPTDMDLLAQELDGHVRSMGWRLIR